VKSWTRFPYPLTVQNALNLFVPFNPLGQIVSFIIELNGKLHLMGECRRSNDSTHIG